MICFSYYAEIKNKNKQNFLQARFIVKSHTRQRVRTLETVNYATWLNSAILNNNSPSLWSTRRMYALMLFLLLHVDIDVLLEHVARSPWHTDYRRGRGRETSRSRGCPAVLPQNPHLEDLGFCCSILCANRAYPRSRFEGRPHGDSERRTPYVER